MINPPFSLDDRVVVVTGGLGNIGRAFARGLLAAGARVAIVDAGKTALPDDLSGNERVATFGADVTDRPALVHACEAMTERWGVPSGLVNAAALDSPPDAPVEENGPFETYPEASWDRVMMVNAKGVFLCCQVFGGAMAAAGRGAIVNIASIYGALSPDQSLYQYRRDRGETFYKPVAYSASKSALYNLTRYLATYWAPRGVRVNTMTLAGVFAGQDPAFLARYVPKVPLGRMATPEDYVGGVVFLLSDAARYMTGADLVIDGGF